MSEPQTTKQGPPGQESRGMAASLLRRLARTRAGVRTAMVVERAWPAVLPLILVASLFLSLSWFGLFQIMPGWMRWAVLCALGLGMLASLIGLRGLRFPGALEVDRRIEQVNRLEHAPVATQTDRLAAGDSDPFAAALWREHQKRMAGRLSRVHGDLPRTSVPERDPWGLRAVAALLFVTAFAYSLGPYGGRIGDAFQPRPAAEATPARIDAWVTPPPYTGRAPIFLTAEANLEQQAFTVPQNSAIAVRVSGGSGEETLSIDDGREAVRDIEPEAGEGDGAMRRFSTLLASDGTVTLSGGASALRQWQFAVIPDEAPQIRFSEEPKRAVNGALELNYEIEDDYGAVEAQAHFSLTEERPDARPLFDAPEMALRLPRSNAENGAAKSSADLTEHPWAGAATRLHLTVADAAEQTGRSEEKTFVLPQRPFTNPLAKALIEQRRLLALDGNQQDRVGALMDALLLWPEETFEEPSHFLLISTVRSKLAQAGSDDALRQVVGDLWEIALIIEDGDLTAAERRLRQAQEALRQALEEGASDEEIASLVDELRQAMQEFLREFAERAMQNQDFAQGENGQTMRESDLQRMLDQIEDLARSGARDQAQDLLSQLENMMNNLQAGRPQQGQGGQQSEMRQQMDQLGELMRRQQELMNETFRMDQQQRGQQGQQGEGQQQGQGQMPGQGQGQQGQGQGQPMTPEELAEALRGLQGQQGALQGDLQSLLDGLEGLGIEPGEGFNEAGEAMGEAEGALGEGRGERAVGEQGRALEALRRGAQDMMNQMQQAMQGQQGEGQQGMRQGSNGRDPLGRPQSTTGPDFGDSVEVPDEIDTQRAREILDAIRRRLGDALSPELEKQYLERLLDMR